MGNNVKKLLYIFIALCITGCVLTKPPESHADYFQYPCTYPFVGTSADVQIVVHGGGQYCDGPMEINGSHYHCESGGGGIGGGAFGLAPIGPLTIGGFGGSGVGINLGGCHFICPDMTPAPFPNPPQAWKSYLVVLDKNNDCLDHMQANGPGGAPPVVDPGPPGQPKPEEYPGPLPGVPNKPVGSNDDPS